MTLCNGGVGSMTSLDVTTSLSNPLYKPFRNTFTISSYLNKFPFDHHVYLENNNSAPKPGRPSTVYVGKSPYPLYTDSSEDRDGESC